MAADLMFFCRFQTRDNSIGSLRSKLRALLFATLLYQRFLSKRRNRSITRKLNFAQGAAKKLLSPMQCTAVLINIQWCKQPVTKFVLMAADGDVSAVESATRKTNGYLIGYPNQHLGARGVAATRVGMKGLPASSRGGPRSRASAHAEASGWKFYTPS